MLPYLHIGMLKIPSYGLFMAIGIITSVFLSYKRLKNKGGNFDSLLLVVSVSMLFALFGATVAYIIFSYGIRRLLFEIISGDFTAFDNFGLVYYGGLIGGIVGAIISVLVNRFDFTLFSDAIVPTIPLGHAFGRIGCLFAGCCYGMPYDGPLAIHSIMVDGNVSLFPVQAMEAGLNFILFFILLFYVNRSACRTHNTLAAYLLLYSIERFIIEYFRSDVIRGVFWGLSSSQWISIAILVGVLIWLAVICFHDRRLTGVKTRRSNNGEIILK